MATASLCCSGLSEAEKIHEQVQGILEAVGAKVSGSGRALHRGCWPLAGSRLDQHILKTDLFDTRFVHHM